MKISPIDIRQHTFEKGFRGYDIDEVNAFLNSLSQEWERVMNDNKLLKMQLEIAEKELNKLRDVEMTLFRTLKTAEDTSNQITEQANRTAEKYIQESRQKTDETIVEARRKASMIIQDAENEAKYIREEIINELKNQERDFRAMEKYRDNLVVQLRSLANNTNEAVERFEKKFSKDPSFEQRMEEVKNQGAEVENPSPKGKKTTAGASSKSESPAEELGATGSTTELPATTGETQSQEESRAMESATEPADVNAETSGEEATLSGAPGEEDPSDQDKATDAPALAEVQEMAYARQQSDELNTSENTASAEEESVKKTKGKGSFFDQIG